MSANTSATRSLTNEDDEDPLLSPPFSRCVSIDEPTTRGLTDLDPLSISLILDAADPAAAAALASTCRYLARGSGYSALWRSLSVDARTVPDSRAPPPGPRLPGVARRSVRTRAAAADVARWLNGGRGAAAQQVSVSWHPAIAASAAVADAALAGTPHANRLSLDAGTTGGALAALPKPLYTREDTSLESLSIKAASLDGGALAAVRGLSSVHNLSICAALTGWAPLLPPAMHFPHLHTVELRHTGVRELPPGLAGAPGLRTLTIVGARLGRDRWSAAATGGAAWSPVGVLCRLRNLQHLSLEDCGLETVPAEVSACTGLRSLNLARNALRSFSCQSVAGLAALEVFDVTHNALGAPLPVRLVESLGALQELRVDGNPYLRKGFVAVVDGRR